MKTKFKTIIPFNIKNINGHIYTKDSFLHSEDFDGNKLFYIEWSAPESAIVDLSHVIGTCNLFMTEEGIKIKNVKFLRDYRNKLLILGGSGYLTLPALIRAGFKLVTAGIGNYDHISGLITTFELICLYPHNESAWS